MVWAVPVYTYGLRHGLSRGARLSYGQSVRISSTGSHASGVAPASPAPNILPVAAPPTPVLPSPVLAPHRMTQPLHMHDEPIASLPTATDAVTDHGTTSLKIKRVPAPLVLLGQGKPLYEMDQSVAQSTAREREAVTVTSPVTLSVPVRAFPKRAVGTGSAATSTGERSAPRTPPRFAPRRNLSSTSPEPAQEKLDPQVAGNAVAEQRHDQTLEASDEEDEEDLLLEGEVSVIHQATKLSFSPSRSRSSSTYSLLLLSESEASATDGGKPAVAPRMSLADALSGAPAAQVNSPLASTLSSLSTLCDSSSTVQIPALASTLLPSLVTPAEPSVSSKNSATHARNLERRASKAAKLLKRELALEELRVQEERVEREQVERVRVAREQRRRVPPRGRSGEVDNSTVSSLAAGWRNSFSAESNATGTFLTDLATDLAKVSRSSDAFSCSSPGRPCSAIPDDERTSTRLR